MLKQVRRWMQPLRRSVFHPQWLATSNEISGKLLSRVSAGSRVLDIGCADRWPRAHLPAGVEYIGLDYPPTATEWYGSRPDVFGDAVRIPFRSEQFDVVILFDVLEHLADPAEALAEIVRVLKPGGQLLMNTPFMYPLHDEPRDFRRWTRHGHQRLAEDAGFDVTEIAAIGKPLRSGFLGLNIALSKACINGIRERRFAALLLPVLPFWIVLNNSLAWLLGCIEPPDDMMPVSYHCILRRPQ